MTGDPNDMLARIKAMLPPSWFPSASPILDGLLSGFAASASWIYGLIGYARAQTRIATATGGWLDLIASDFFGRRFERGNRSDTLFRKAIVAEIFRPRQTREAFVDVLVGLTGRAPIIFEPARPQDAGGYSPGPSGDSTGRDLAYGLAGGYGSLLMDYQLLVHAFRPATAGIPSVGAYATLSAYTPASGGLPLVTSGGWPGGYSTPASGSAGALASTIGAYSTPSSLEYGNLDLI